MSIKMTLPLTVVAMLVGQGCVNIGIRQTMQPDHSYEILAMGNPAASLNDLEKEARKRADQLCPGGWDKKSQIPEDETRPRLTLIVMCK